MKKALVIFMAVIITAAAFAGCTAKKEVADQTGNPKNVTTANEWQKTTITTDTAKISNSDAINYIKSYSAKELSLTDEEMKTCDFLVSGTGVKIENDYYIKVSAVIKHENGKDDNGNSLFTFDNKGEYYIRYDGKQVLKKDMSKDSNEYIELEVKKLPEKTTAAAEKESKADSKDATKEAEESTKK